MKITFDTKIEEVVPLYPDSVKIFMRFGIPAISCGEPIWGTIGEAIKKYNVGKPDELIRELNEIAIKGPQFKIQK